MQITNEMLTDMINKHLKDSPYKKYFKLIWEYGKQKLLVCEFSHNNVRFGIDISPKDTDSVLMKLCWRKPYELYGHKLKVAKSTPIKLFNNLLDEIVEKCINFINNNGKIKVSVIVPIFNREKTLNRLISSFQSQTMSKEEFEVIFVDDKSSDRSIEVIEQLSQGFNYSILKSPVQSGNASQPRNIGIKAARGIYTLFVDSDDYIDQDCLLNAYDYAIKNKADIVYLKCESVNEGRSLKSRLWNGINNIEDADIFSNYLLMSFYSFKLFKTNILVQNSIYFDKSLFVGEDQVFLVNALCNSNKVSILKDKTYYFLTTEQDVEHLSKIKESSINLFKKWTLCLNSIVSVRNHDKKKKLYNCLFFRFLKKYSDNFNNPPADRIETLRSVLQMFAKYHELYDDSLIYSDGKICLDKLNWNTVIQQEKELLQNTVISPSEESIVGIMNFHFANNFGAVLVPYSLLKVVRKLGYKAEIINYSPKEIPLRKDYAEFRKVFLNISTDNKLLTSHDDLVNFQSRYNKIIVGSDQVWRLFNTSTYMLDFAYGNKTLISYAASFGGNSFSKLTNEKATSLLNRFDAISVRESSGVNICNEQFGLSAMHVLDPTLLLTDNDYEEIINHFNPHNIDGQYAAYSVINKDNKEFVPAFLDRIGNSMNIKFKNLLSKYGSKEVNSVGGWLNDIKNSKFVITDSFHATVFSIIYRKKFVCLVTGANGSERIPSLLNSLGIDCYSRVVDSLDKITPKMIETDIDYSSVSERLSKMKNKSIMFLMNALNKKENFKDIV